MNANADDDRDREPTAGGPGGGQSDADTGSVDSTDEDAEPRAGQSDEETGAGESVPDDGGSGSDPATTPQTDRPRRGGPPVDGSGGGTPEGSLVAYVQWGLLAILILVTAIASVQLYLSASTAVDRFVASRYRPVFQAGFNVVVLLVAGVGLSVLVRRLR